jgi:outer membrane lipoprotein-sorting protein
MKKAVMAIWIVCLLFLFGCKEEAPTIVGVWSAETSIFNTENDAESIRITFYDGMEGSESHIKNGTTYKSYNFDYELNGDILSVYVGPEPTDYSIAFGEANGTETMTLTAEDGTVYSYILSSHRTPGIRQY